MVACPVETVPPRQEWWRRRADLCGPKAHAGTVGRDGLQAGAGDSPAPKSATPQMPKRPAPKTGAGAATVADRARRPRGQASIEMRSATRARSPRGIHPLPWPRRECSRDVRGSSLARRTRRLDAPSAFSARVCLSAPNPNTDCATTLSALTAQGTTARSSSTHAASSGPQCWCSKSEAGVGWRGRTTERTG